MAYSHKRANSETRILGCKSKLWHLLGRRNSASYSNSVSHFLMNINDWGTHITFCMELWEVNETTRVDLLEESLGHSKHSVNATVVVCCYYCYYLFYEPWVQVHPHCRWNCFSQLQCSEWVITKSGCQLPELLNCLSTLLQSLLFLKSYPFFLKFIDYSVSSTPPFLFKDIKSQRKQLENHFFYCHPFVVPFSLFILLSHLYQKKNNTSCITLSSVPGGL